MLIQRTKTSLSSFEVMLQDRLLPCELFQPRADATRDRRREDRESMGRRERGGKERGGRGRIVRGEREEEKSEEAEGGS